MQLSVPTRHMYYMINLHSYTGFTLSRRPSNFVNIRYAHLTIRRSQLRACKTSQVPLQNEYTLQKEFRRVSYALDNCGNFVDFLGVGNDQFLHDGWIHSPAARSGAHRCANTRDTRPKACRLAKEQSHNKSENTGGVFSTLGKIHRRFLSKSNG